MNHPSALRKTVQHQVTESGAVDLRSGFRIPLFLGLSCSQITDVLALGRILKVSSGMRLCGPDQKASSLFLVTKGRIKYSRETLAGEEILIRLFTPFECFGLSTLLPDPPNCLGTAEPLVSGEVIAWKHAEMLQIADRYASIKTNALRVALEYLGALSDRHSSLFDGTAKGRIARVLVDVGRRGGVTNSEGIEVHITNEHLGSLADVSRFTVSRVLSDWGRTGFVTKTRETIRIHAPEALLSDFEGGRAR